MKHAVAFLVVIMGACGSGTESTPPTSPPPETGSAATPAAGPAAPGGAVTPGGAVAAPARPAAPAVADSPSGAIARRAFERYLDVTAAFWKETAAVAEQADDARRFDHARMRANLEATYKAFGEIDAELARAADDPGFAVEMCLACIERDWNLNGRIDDGDRLLLQVEVDERGNELPDGDPRRKPTFRFDAGDLHWGRAMLAFQRAALDLILAYEWKALDDLFLAGDEDFDEDGRKAKAPPPVLRIKLTSSARVTSARDLILAGIDHAEKCRAAYLAETDDDREWVPSPRQKNHPVPLALDQAIYDRWAAILGDVRRLVRGEEGLSLRDLGTLVDDDFAILSGYLDVGRLLSKPADFAIELGLLEDTPRGMTMKQAADKLLRSLFGAAYVKKMKPSPLPGRLHTMRKEIERDEGELDRKLRYLLWLN